MLKGITIGQYVAGDSFVHRMDPRGKIFTVFILMAALFTAKMVFHIVLLLLLRFLLFFYLKYR